MNSLLFFSWLRISLEGPELERVEEGDKFLCKILFLFPFKGF
jgi:hypothetical protein